MASEEEVADILQPMKGEGNYIATTPLLIMKCNQGGLSSSLEECLDKEYISHGHAIDRGNCILGCIFSHGSQIICQESVKPLCSICLHLQRENYQ
jgi:hypothetical protein